MRSLRRGGAQGAGRRARVKWLGKKKIKIKRERRKDLVESKKVEQRGATEPIPVKKRGSESISASLPSLAGKGYQSLQGVAPTQTRVPHAYSCVERADVE